MRLWDVKRFLENFAVLILPGPSQNFKVSRRLKPRFAGGVDQWKESTAHPVRKVVFCLSPFTLSLVCRSRQTSSEGLSPFGMARVFSYKKFLSALCWMLIARLLSWFSLHWFRLVQPSRTTGKLHGNTQYLYFYSCAIVKFCLHDGNRTSIDNSLFRNPLWLSEIRYLWPLSKPKM